jgi:parallel beta-helix repeat protein
VSGGSNGNFIGGTKAVDGNRISYNGLNGVHIDEGSDGNSVAFDTLDDNASNGVLIEDTLNTIVSNCTSESNKGWGILVTGSSAFKLSNNTVSQNGAGGEKD